MIGCSETESDTLIEQRIVNDLEMEFDSLFESTRFNGVFLAAECDDVLYSKAFGYSDKQNNIKNELNTKFLIASITKTFTATCIMMLQEDGLLKVEDSVSDYIDLPIDKSISIHDLLSHTSGIPDYSQNPRYKRLNFREFITPKELAELIQFNQTRAYKIGEYYQYSNSNYILLGMIIEKVSGKTFIDFLKERIFIPSGMTNSGIYEDGYYSEIESIALGYRDLNYKRTEDYNASIASSGGGIYSTAEDLYKWHLFLESDSLSKSSKESMFSKKSGNHEYKYGYGWFIRKDLNAITHSGGLPGFRSILYKQLDKKRVIIIISNTNLGDLNNRILLASIKLLNKYQ